MTKAQSKFEAVVEPFGVELWFWALLMGCELIPPPPQKAVRSPSSSSDINLQEFEHTELAIFLSCLSFFDANISLLMNCNCPYLLENSVQIRLQYH